MPSSLNVLYFGVLCETINGYIHFKYVASFLDKDIWFLSHLVHVMTNFFCSFIKQFVWLQLSLVVNFISLMCSYAYLKGLKGVSFMSEHSHQDMQAFLFDCNKYMLKYETN